MSDPYPVPTYGEPFAASRGGCGAASDTQDGVSGFSPCNREVTHAGTKSYRYPSPETWRSFACDAHAHRLDDPHPLTADDQRELDDRREQERRGRAGLVYRRPQPLRGRPGVT